MKIILATLIIIYFGFLPQWHYTLNGDIKNYYFPVANHIFTKDTLIYPPLANLFFLLFPTTSLAIYESFFVVANVFLLLIFSKIIKNQLILSLLILCAGPIILFRFDLLVILLFALSIKTFTRSNFILSGIFLGAATMVKFFPLVLLPYFLLVLWPQKKVIPFIFAFVLTVAIILVLYLNVTKLDLSTIVTGLYFNFSKSVHMESVLGSVLTIITAITNPGPHGVQFISALWVLDPLYLLGHARGFRLFPLVGLAFVYALAIFLFKKNKDFRPTTCLFIILALIITSQTFSPQYLLWVAFLFPLLPNNKTNLFLVLLALVCTQIIYPLNYGELIDFFNLGINQHLFLIITLRNLLLVVLVIRLFIYDKLLSLLSKK